MNYVDDILNLPLRPSHKYYWNNRASRHHISRMLRLGSVEQLQGDVNGVSDSRYLMHRVAELTAPDGARRYEFLIEYDVFNPSQGIYFGCKSVTLPDFRHSKEVSLANEDWQRVRPHILRRLNNTFVDKDFTHRFRNPDNTNDNTFWPFWISLYEDEDPQELAVRALSIIAATYRQLFDGSLPEISGQESQEEKVIIPRTAFTDEAYLRLRDSFLTSVKAASLPVDSLSIAEGPSTTSITSTTATSTSPSILATATSDYKSSDARSVLNIEASTLTTSPFHSHPLSIPEQAWNLFETFLQKAVVEGILHKVDYYEKAWMLDSRFTDIDFKCMMSLLFSGISEKLKIGLPKIPWSGLIGIFLRSDGTPFKQQIKTLNPTPTTRRYWTAHLPTL